MLIRFKGIVNIRDGRSFSAMEICIFSKQKQSSGKKCSIKSESLQKFEFRIFDLFLLRSRKICCEEY